MRTPPKHDRAQSIAFTVASAVVILAALYFMRGILIPLAFALTITFLLTPVVAFLERLHLGRVLSVMLTLLVSLTVTAWVAWIIGNQLVDVVNQLPTYRENIHSKIQALSLSKKGPLGRAAASMNEIDQELSNAGLSPTVSSPSRPVQKRDGQTQSPVAVEMVKPSATGLTYVRDLSASFLRPLAAVGIVIIFAIFMLMKREDLRNRVLRLAGLGQLNVMTQALDDAAKRVSRYLLMQFLVNASFGIVIGAGLYAIGLPNPALWAAVACLLRIVPYAGTLVAGGLPLLLSLAVFNGWLQPLLVFLLFTVLELMVGNFLEPWLYGAHTGISSLALLVSAVCWTVLWGPAGLVLSTPLTVCVVVLGRYIPSLSFLHILLGDEPVLSADAHLYQRLLAMDQQEARTVVDDFLKTKPLVELYDTVLIPALNMAEQDRHRGDIDATREEFLFLSVNEMVAEFSDHRPLPNVPEGEGAQPASEPVLPFHGRIFCLPAHDEADAIAGAMLAQILEQDGCAALTFPVSTSLDETIAVLGLTPADIIFISALPPYAFSPARTLCRQLRARCPNLMIAVCVWGYEGDTEKAKARFEKPRPEQLITSINQAVELIHKLAQPEEQVLGAREGGLRRLLFLALER